MQSPDPSIPGDAAPPAEINLALWRRLAIAQVVLTLPYSCVTLLVLVDTTFSGSSASGRILFYLAGPVAIALYSPLSRGSKAARDYSLVVWILATLGPLADLLMLQGSLHGGEFIIFSLACLGALGLLCIGCVEAVQLIRRRRRV